MIFSYCNMFLEKSQRKPLDISGEMAYNKREEGIPVDGLLPLAIKEITAQLGTWGGYFRLLLSCMMRMIWQMRLSKVSTSMSVIAITPFRERGFDRLPFVACPQNFSITHLSKLVKFSEYDIVKIKENGVVGTVVDIYSTKESFTR